MASFFLPRAVADDAAVVYRFCRTVDDAVDESVTTAGAMEAVTRLRRELRGIVEPTSPICDYLKVATRLDISSRVAEALVSGVRSDLGSVRIRSLRELGCYAYRVAGVVGQMMSRVLNVRSAEAVQFAVDLGLAMQLTNICRDVMEDACKNRVYLPADLLIQHGMTAHDVVCRTAARNQIAGVVDEILEMAEVLYERAYFGTRYIPLRSRLGILVALRLYRGIGRKLKRVHHSNPYHGRTRLSLVEKTWLCFGALGDAFKSLFRTEEGIESVPPSPFECSWEALAAPCRLDAELLDSDFGSLRRQFNVAS